MAEELSPDLLRVSYLQEVGRQLQKNSFTTVDGVIRNDEISEAKQYKLRENNKNQLIEIQRSLFLIYDNLRDQTASNYTNNIPSGGYGFHFRYLGENFAKSILEFQSREEDQIYQLTRDKLLYQNLGYLLGFEGGFSPFFITYDSNEMYRRVLLSLVHALLQGSTENAIQEGLEIFTEYPVEIFPLYEDPVNYAQVYKRFMWRINILVGTDRVMTINLDDQRTNIERIVKIMKPAHTLLDIGFVWQEEFNFTIGCFPVLDGDGNPIYDVVRSPFEFDYGDDDQYEDLLNDVSSVLNGADPLWRGDTVPWAIVTPGARLTACEQYHVFLETRDEEIIDTSNFVEDVFITSNELNSDDYNFSGLDTPTAYTEYPQLHFDNPQWFSNRLNDPLARTDYGLQVPHIV